ncbi:ATP-dependent helicase [Curvibacter sp. APW13]|uniref:ATP-dependent helicase n=1 Tax=Curvibacter sp. APW13 TaxID=3077236 RepID=UPI0028DDC291|nr:ATP-dependent helicase [Curvibacter sp. APW13]MDT8992879.1 ATP-dependent helicase [Curvibacter sp. APW13]
MATRQDFANPDFWRLDDRQAPVFLCDKPCVAIAGPGSGKTRTIIAKAARLIQANANDLSSIAMVTFTKAAAKEMEHRLKLALPDLFASRAGRSPFIGTFHGLSYRLLQNYWQKAGIRRKILSDQEVYDLIVQSTSEAGSKLRFDEAQRAIERYKSLPADFPLGDEEILSEAYQIFSIYEKRRVANSACDVNDMVRECLAGIRAGTIKPLPVKHLLADEMQDADLAQIDWVLAHYSHGVTPSLVADDDQSIYAFRNAAGFRGLKLFVEATGAQVFPMTYNYRSCTSIVEAADLIIRNSPDRFAKDIQAKRTEEGSIDIEVHRASIDPQLQPETVQAKQVVLAAKHWMESHPKSSAAVIARTNIELDSIELACKMLQVPFIRMGSSDFLKRPHIVRALLALNLPNNPTDHIAFSSACFVSDNIAAPARTAILEFFHQSDGMTHVLDLASAQSLLATMRRDDQTAFRAFRGWISEWFEEFELGTEHLSASIVKLLGRFASQCKDSQAAKDLNFLAVMLSQWSSGTLANRINLLNQRSEQPKDKVGAITLCSAHASKGLEFEHVTIINATDDYWPHDKDESAFGEEKRLFYVAATRARDHLTISMYEGDGKKKVALTCFVQPILEEAMRVQRLSEIEGTAQTAHRVDGEAINA